MIPSPSSHSPASMTFVFICDAYGVRVRDVNNEAEAEAMDDEGDDDVTKGRSRIV